MRHVHLDARDEHSAIVGRHIEAAGEAKSLVGKWREREFIVGHAIDNHRVEEELVEVGANA